MPPTDSHEDLRLRPWVKVTFWLLAAGLMVGTAYRLGWRVTRHEDGPSAAATSPEVATVGVSPDGVSGRVLRVLVAEGETVAAGRVVAEIDPAPYRERLDAARARLAAAEAELKYQEATVARLRKAVPQRAEAAALRLAAAKAEQARADDAVKRAAADTAADLDAAKAELDAVQVEAAAAKAEFDRVATLVKQDALSARRSQDAARAVTVADARVKACEARVARAEADRGRPAGAKLAADAVAAAVKAAEADVAAAAAAKDEPAEADQLTEARRQALDEAELGVVLAERATANTQVKSPVLGVVHKVVRVAGDVATPGQPVVLLRETK